MHITIYIYIYIYIYRSCLSSFDFGTWAAGSPPDEDAQNIPRLPAHAGPEGDTVIDCTILYYTVLCYTILCLLYTMRYSRWIYNSSLCYMAGYSK